VNDSDRPDVRQAALAGAAVGRRGWGVRSYLLAVVLSSLLPLAIFAGYLSYDGAQSQLATIRTSIISTTRALAVAVDEHIGVRRDMLEELARSERLRAGDLAGFHAEMVNLSRLLGGTIITLVRPDGTRALSAACRPMRSCRGRRMRTWCGGCSRPGSRRCPTSSSVPSRRSPWR